MAISLILLGTELLLTLSVHAQRGLQYLVRSVCMCVCVCVSVSLVSRAITRPTRDTNGISVTWTVNERRYLYKCFVRAYRSHFAQRAIFHILLHVCNMRACVYMPCMHACNLCTCAHTHA